LITDLSTELDHPIDTDEFRTLNRCLDNGIADAVTEFSHQRRLINDDREEQAMNQRLGVLAHELRNLVNTASHALGVIKSGQVGFGGATGAVLDRTMTSLRGIAHSSLAEVRLTAGLTAHRELTALSGFIADVKESAIFDAQSRGCEFSVSVVGRGLAIKVDRELLFSAVINLLQNAFKFTAHGTRVSLTAYAEEDRIRIDVHDHCGGLPPGIKEDLFVPFKQHGADTSGAGLGLSICRRSVEANNGVLSVRDIPGSGCVFSIELPRHSMEE
jgi:signal transduction histidine kinase